MHTVAIRVNTPRSVASCEPVSVVVTIILLQTWNSSRLPVWINDKFLVPEFKPRNRSVTLTCAPEINRNSPKTNTLSLNYRIVNCGAHSKEQAAGNIVALVIIVGDLVH